MNGESFVKLVRLVKGSTTIDELVRIVKGSTTMFNEEFVHFEFFFFFLKFSFYYRDIFYPYSIVPNK